MKNETLDKVTVAGLTNQVNTLIAEINVIERGIVDKNTKQLILEILNLKDGVGEGFIEGDHYAGNRYSSSIPGVKNIREYGNFKISVKVTSQVGYLVPEEIKIWNDVYEISCFESSKFQSQMDY